jgi:RNA polymerase sporulation-specific sigma factor
MYSIHHRRKKCKFPRMGIPADTKNTAESIVESISIADAIDQLPQRERTIINLRFFQGQTQMEIAEEIGISQAQVSRLEKYALKKIKS